MIITIPIKTKKILAHLLIQSLFSAILMVYKWASRIISCCHKAARKDLLPIVVMTFTESPKIVQSLIILICFYIFEPGWTWKKIKAWRCRRIISLILKIVNSPVSRQKSLVTYIKAMNAKIIVAGFDYTFGSWPKTAEDLKDYFDGEVIIVPPRRWERKD